MELNYYKKYLSLAVLLSLLLINSNLLAKVFYVGKNGNDTNSGLKVKESLASINCAIEKASAGDTIYILPGTYNEAISINGKSGEPEKTICISGYSDDPDDFPVIDAGINEPSLDASKMWMILSGSQWIGISKLKFMNGWTLPIKIDNSSYVSFNRCEFKGAKRVISASGLSTHHILIENCSWDQGGEYLWKIERDLKGIDAWTSMHHGDMAYFNGSLIDFSGTGGSIVIRNNTIKNAFNAIRFRGQKGCDSNVEIYGNDISYIRDNDFEPEYYTYNVHIYHNRSHNIHRTLSIDNVEGGNIYYYGNVITTDDDEWSKKICAGFWKIYGTERLLSFPVFAFNNSFYGTGRSFTSEHSQTSKLLHFNNAYYYTVKGGWVLNKYGKDNEFDYDISNEPWPVSLNDNFQEKHGKLTDVRYSDPVKKDLHLQKDSPCIDAGKVMSFKEFNWVQSYKGSAPEVGAYEDGRLVDGPAFRFMTPPDGKITYKEKPRIVKRIIQANKLYLYFSDALDPATAGKDNIKLYSGMNAVDIKNISFPNNNYEMVIEAGSGMENDDLSISFTSLPSGLNGEKVTYWASVLKVQKD